jgi:cytochrome bd-type quinol oxidase subunit 2
LPSDAPMSRTPPNASGRVRGERSLGIAEAVARAWNWVSWAGLLAAGAYAVVGDGGYGASGWLIWPSLAVFPGLFVHVAAATTFGLAALPQRSSARLRTSALARACAWALLTVGASIAALALRGYPYLGV